MTQAVEHDAKNLAGKDAVFGMSSRPALEGKPPSASLPPGNVSTPPLLDESSLILQVTERINQEARIRNHYYVKIAVSTLLCALLLLIGVPVFMESRVTGSISYTALGVVLVGFGLILAVAVVVLLFRPPWNK